MEKLPAVGEEVQEEHRQGNTFPRSFAAVVKSAKFVEQEAKQPQEADRLNQEKLAKKIVEERRKAEEKADREAAKDAEEVRKNKEAEERRSAHLVKLEDTSKKAKEHKEKVRTLTVKPRRHGRHGSD